MTFKQIEYFLAFASCMNYTTAAKICFTTQPNLGRQIENLEKELETKLIVRIGNKFELTNTGKLLEERGRQLMSFYNEMLDELKQSKKPDIIFGYTTRHALMDALRKYVGDRFCGYRIQWVHGTGVALLDAGLLDICFTFSPQSEYYVKLTDSSVYAIIPRQLISPCSQIDPADLAKYPITLPAGTLHRVCMDFFSEYDLLFDIHDFPAAIFDKAFYLQHLQTTGSIGFVPIDDYRMYEDNFFIAKVTGLTRTVPVGIEWAAKKDHDCRPIAEKMVTYGKKLLETLPSDLI